MAAKIQDDVKKGAEKLAEKFMNFEVSSRASGPIIWRGSLMAPFSFCRKNSLVTWVNASRVRLRIPDRERPREGGLLPQPWNFGGRLAH